MAYNCELRRSSGTDFADKVYVATSWFLIPDKPPTYTPTAHDTRVDELTYLDLSTVGKVVFDGDAGESWLLSSSFTNTCAFYINNVFNTSDVLENDTTTAISNLFLQRLSYSLDQEGFFRLGTSNYLYIRLNKSHIGGWSDAWTDTEKVSAFKTWLASNNLVVYYKLSGVTPTFTFADLKTWLGYKDTTAALSYVFDSGDGKLSRKILPKVKTEIVTSAAVVAGLGFTPEPAIGKGTNLQYFRGDMSLATMPTSLPASDVYAWAKATSKPTYTYDEVGASPDGHTHSGYAELAHAHGNISASGTLGSPGDVLVVNDNGVIVGLAQSNAFNAAFGTTHATVAYGDHAHAGVYTPAYAGIRQVTASGSLVNTDNNKIVYVSGAYTLSIPTVDNGDFVIGTQITIISATTSTITIDPLTDVYINGATSSITISIPYRAITLVMYATDYWFAIGVV